MYINMKIIRKFVINWPTILIINKNKHMLFSPIICSTFKINFSMKWVLIKTLHIILIKVTKDAMYTKNHNNLNSKLNLDRLSTYQNVIWKIKIILSLKAINLKRNFAMIWNSKIYIITKSKFCLLIVTLLKKPKMKIMTKFI